MANESLPGMARQADEAARFCRDLAAIYKQVVMGCAKDAPPFWEANWGRGPDDLKTMFDGYKDGFTDPAKSLENIADSCASKATEWRKLYDDQKQKDKDDADKAKKSAEAGAPQPQAA